MLCMHRFVYQPPTIAVYPVLIKCRAKQGSDQSRGGNEALVVAQRLSAAPQAGSQATAATRAPDDRSVSGSFSSVRNVNRRGSPKPSINSRASNILCKAITAANGAEPGLFPKDQTLGTRLPSVTGCNYGVWGTRSSWGILDPRQRGQQPGDPLSASTGGWNLRAGSALLSPPGSNQPRRTRRTPNTAGVWRGAAAEPRCE